MPKCISFDLEVWCKKGERYAAPVKIIKDVALRTFSNRSDIIEVYKLNKQGDIGTFDHECVMSHASVRFTLDSIEISGIENRYAQDWILRNNDK